MSNPGRPTAPGDFYRPEVIVVPKTTSSCPHCGAPLIPFRLPDDGGWDGTFQLACFSDECPYFVRGWAWIEEHYGVKSSYRYRLNPANDQASPIPVWSRDALRDRIIEVDVAADTAGGDVIPDDGGEKGSHL